ncbi:MAG: ABC transporter substrate-binding protein [Aliidongia sp.]
MATRPRPGCWCARRRSRLERRADQRRRDGDAGILGDHRAGRRGQPDDLPPDPRNNPAAKDIVAEFKKSGYDPEGYTLYTYAAMQVFAQAAEKATSTKLADLVKVLHSDSFDTVVGSIKFDAKGDVLNPEYVFYIWKDGKYSEM